MRKPSLLAAALLLLPLCACGTTPQDRAITGGGLGAAAGTATAIVLDTNPITGLLVGGAVGAIGGAVTNNQQIDLGKPIWDTWQH